MTHPKLCVGDPPLIKTFCRGHTPKEKIACVGGQSHAIL